jgi:hypothetical protein
MTIVRSEVSLVAQVDVKIDQQISYKINRDGVLVTSNKYGLIFFSMKNNLYIGRMKQFEDLFDEAEDEHSIETIEGGILHFILTDEITQISLSRTELLLSICCHGIIFICDIRTLLIPPPHARKLPFLHEIHPKVSSVVVDFVCRWSKYGSDKFAVLNDENLHIYDGYTGTIISMLRIPHATCCDWCPGNDKIMISCGSGVVIKDSTLHTDYGHFDHLFPSNYSSMSSLANEFTHLPLFSLSLSVSLKVSRISIGSKTMSSLQMQKKLLTVQIPLLFWRSFH